MLVWVLSVVGDAHDDFDGLIMTVFISAVNSCFATWYFSFDKWRAFAEVGLLLPVSIVCLILIVEVLGLSLCDMSRVKCLFSHD